MSVTLTITLECFLSFCEAEIESFSHMGGSVQFIPLDENIYILKKNRIFFVQILGNLFFSFLPGADFTVT